MPAYKLHICGSNFQPVGREQGVIYVYTPDITRKCRYCNGAGGCDFDGSYCLDGIEARVWIRCPTPGCNTMCRLRTPWNEQQPGEYHKVVRVGNLYEIHAGGGARSILIDFQPCKLHFFIGHNDPPPPPCAPCSRQN